MSQGYYHPLSYGYDNLPGFEEERKRREKIQRQAERKAREKRAMEHARAGGECLLLAEDLSGIPASSWTPSVLAQKCAKKSAGVISSIMDRVDVIGLLPVERQKDSWWQIWLEDGEICRRNAPGYTKRKGADFNELASRALGLVRSGKKEKARQLLNPNQPEKAPVVGNFAFSQLKELIK